MKKLTPLHWAFVAILMLTLLMATSASAATCTETEHVGPWNPYVDSSFDEHSRVCLNCGTRVYSAHNFGAWEHYDTTRHIRYCIQCEAGRFDYHTFTEWTAKDNTSHSRSCTTAGCTYTEYEDHKGGTATCVSKANCEVCDRAYGSTASTHNWAVSSYSDTAHTYTCPDCQRTKSEAHVMSAWAVKDNTTHFRSCTVAGCTYTEYENHYGGTATCASKPNCEVCGRAYGSASTTHDWQLTSQDSTQHTYTCSVCKRTKSEAHSWGKWIFGGASIHTHICSICKQNEHAGHNFIYTANGAQHTITCADCSLNMSEAHDLGTTYTNAGDQHTRTCSKCKATDRKAHTWGSWENVEGTNTHQRTCTANGCGAVDTAKCSYVWQEASTAGYHVQYCATCGDYANTGKHSGGTATCVAKATCTTCGLTYGTTGSHSWGEWVVTDPTCYEDGSRTRTCSVCSKTETETIACTGHLGSFWTVEATPATCGTDGVRATICRQCGDTTATEAIPATGNHVWGEWKSAGGGLHTRSCQNSGCTATQTASHNYGKDVYNGPSLNHYNHVKTCADCGEQIFSWCTLSAWTATGATQHTATCSVCGGKPTAAHTWGEWVVTDPTCAKDGSKTRTCTVCGYADTVTLPATGKHTWGEWKADNEKTHTHTCTVCGATESNSHSWQVISVTPATCISRQVTHSECTVCGAGSHVTSGGYADHTLGAWEISSSSAHVRYCSTEGCTYTETAGHTLTDWTAKDNITHSRYCTAGCGYTEYENHYGGTATCCSKAECVICGRPYGDTASTHNWQLESSTTGNCVTVATQTYRCPDCQRTEVRNGAVNPTVHTGNVTVKTVLAPTCTSKGMNEVYCADCSALLYTDPIDVIPHTPKMTTIVEPTCCEDGYSQLICTECHQEVNNGKKYPIDATGDHIDDWRETTSATCTTGGVETLYCGRSNKLLGDTRSTDPLGHLMGEPVVTPATCIAEGKSVATCQRPGCTYSETETLPMVDHVEGEPVDDPKPTCCEPGLRSWYCVNCDTLLRTEVLPALGHKDGEYEWVTTKEPTCTEEGEEKKVCAHSGKDLGETRAIPALGHIYTGLWQVGESDTHYRDCYRCGAGRVNVECTYLPLEIDDTMYQVCPVCGRFHDQKLEVVEDSAIAIATGSKPGSDLVRMLAQPFGEAETRYPAILTAIFEAGGYIADPAEDVTGITVTLPLEMNTAFKLVFVHVDDATGELVWTDVAYTLNDSVLSFTIEEMGLFLFIAE